MGIHIEPTTYPVIPTADYTGKIVDVTEVQSEYNGETRERLRFRFDVGDVEDEEGELVEHATVPGYTSVALSARSYLWKLAVAAGVDPSKGLDTDDLLGKRVTIAVTVGVREDGTPKNTVDMANVRPAKPSKKVPPTAVKVRGSDATVPVPADNGSGEPPAWASEDIPF